MRLSVLNMLNLGRSNRIMSVSEALEQLRSVYFGFTDKLRKHPLKITDCLQNWALWSSYYLKMHSIL